MMIVDLVDEIDFKEQLMSIGVPIDLEWPMDQLVDVVKGWLEESTDRLEILKKLCAKLDEGHVTVLPEVAEQLERLIAL